MLLVAQPILEAYSPPASTTKQLAIVLVGSDPASELFVSLKRKRAQTYGITTDLIRLPESTEESTILATIATLASDPVITGIIVQLPLPHGFDTDRILAAIPAAKDVDALTSTSPYVSPMVLAVAALKDHYDLSFTNKQVCIVGNGRLVGQPVAAWLKQYGIEPDVLDITSNNKDERIRAADVVIAGTGQNHMVNETNTRPGQIIFDCSGHDVDFESVQDKVAAITPPNGSIGPLTIHFLLTNVLA